MAKRKRRDVNPQLMADIIENYDVKTAADLQDALTDLMGSTLETMLETELDSELGYEKNQNAVGISDNRRNGYSKKKVRSNNGEFEIDVPRDRNNEFEPTVVNKRQKNITEIEDKIINMYARGMSQRDIARTIDEIYGFTVSKDMVSKITDKIMPEVDAWTNRSLQRCYPFIFVDCMYVSMEYNNNVSKRAVYAILGYTITGQKELLGIWFADSESKSQWMSIFDEIKNRGVEDIFFISMDGVSGLEQGAKSVFKDVVVQRCIVHLVRNAVKFIPSKDMKEFTKDLKSIYAATNLKNAQTNLEKLNSKWGNYPGALRVFNDNFEHIEQLYNYGSDVRRIMYTTNPIEAVNSSFRKVTKKGTFSSEKSLLKVLYLRNVELEQKWSKGRIRNWSMVLNQLMIDDNIAPRLDKFFDN